MILLSKKSENATRKSVISISFLLILATASVYWQVHGFDFVNYDDNDFVYDNPHVQDGITFDSIIWALTTRHASNWFPLTWLSHMLDCQMFGLWAGGHHLTSLFFHIANALLLFFVFRKMTGKIWQSGFVAALFALHPLHVESVAWVSERKDVLSAFFWMLTLWAYARYVGRPGWATYAWVLVFFILGLMSKPMVVTLPFVLLLLDYWPLNRIRLNGSANHLKFNISGLLREKMPLFLLAAASAGITFYVQQKGGAVQSFDAVPLVDRLPNLLISYVTYIIKALFPVNLSIFYPYPSVFPFWKVTASLVMLAGLTVLAIRLMRRSPYVIVGWLLFIGSLVPVIGLVQVGSQSMADRYMYIPMIGLLIIVAWGIPDLMARSRYKRAGLGVLAVITIVSVSAITWTQTGHWRNSITLFSHAIEIMPDNSRAHNNLGEALSKKGELLQAMQHYKTVLKLRPRHHAALINMGLTLLNMGKPSDAFVYFNRILEIKPDDSQVLRLAGYAMAAQGNYEKAISYYDQALKTDPLNGELHFLMGVAHNALQKPTTAIAHYQKAIEIKPDDTMASINLGNIYYRNGRMDLAGKAYLYALQHEPNNPDVLSKLGAVALGLGHTDSALKFFNQALKIRPDHQESQKGLDAVLRIKQNKKKHG